MDTQVFNPLTIPTKGTHLIEASAGTGKTYGIAALFTRWVVLEKKPVGHILVLTFTDPAAAELKLRLRARLAQVLYILQNREDGQVQKMVAAEDFLRDLLAELDKTDGTDAEHILRLQAALTGFDTAGIYTIHGFCRSVLADEAFLCGAPFSLSLENQWKQEIQQLTDDFWRKEIAADAATARLAVGEKLKPDNMVKDLQKSVGTRYGVEMPQENYAAAQQNLDTAWKNLQAAFKESAQTPAQEVIDAVTGKILNGKSQTKEKDAEEIQQYFAQNSMSQPEYDFWQIQPRLNANKVSAKSFFALFRFLADADALQQLLQTRSEKETQTRLRQLQKFQAENLQECVAAKEFVNENEIARLAVLSDFSAALNTFLDEQDAAKAALHLRLLDFIRNGIDGEKQRKNQRSFDDLLLDVDAALRHKTTGKTLQRRLSAAWDALLVDEFQDTNPLQYGIFKTAFADHGVPMYLVGDPKQAIYRFRGADIFTYLKAAADAGANRYTLDTNYRSHQGLIDIFATLFARQLPFVHEGIDYPQVKAARAAGALSPALPALTVLSIGEGGVDELRKKAAEVCADHIAGLLNNAASGSLKRADRPLAAGDIAVLTNSHFEADLVQKALKANGLASVSLGKLSVFAADEAYALLALLEFWLTPAKTDLLRNVLVSPLCALSAEELNTFNGNNAEIARLTHAAVQAGQIWHDNSFMAAYQSFNRAARLEENLLTRRAERTLTNLFQLLELLTGEEANHFDPYSLSAWLRNEIAAARTDEQYSEHTQLRLESDENLIKIFTVHKAKGLQYGVVYCPFFFTKNQTGIGIVEKVTREEKTQWVWGGELKEEESALLGNEQISEKLRLFYVALTRAEEALVLCAPDDKKAEKSAPGYLIGMTDNESLWAAWQKWQQQNAHLGGLVALQAESPPKTVYKAAAAPASVFQAAEAPCILPVRRFGAFTSWQKSLTHGTALPTPDEVAPKAGDEDDTPPPRTLPESYSVATFPKGAHSGNCWHSILERFDFSRPAAAQAKWLEKCLRSYGFDAEKWLPAVTEMADNTRLCRLNPGFSLKDIPAEKRLPEMKFRTDRIKLHTAKIKEIGTTLPEPVRQALSAAAARPLDALFDGFIDLGALDKEGNAYIIDYKSNYLGGTAEDYSGEKLDAAMAEHQYAVQSAIYAVALRRYLHSRKIFPKKFYIRYLFLRGVRQNSSNGVWHWDLGEEELARLDKSWASAEAA